MLQQNKKIYWIWFPGLGYLQWRRAGPPTEMTDLLNVQQQTLHKSALYIQTPMRKLPRLNVLNVHSVFTIINIFPNGCWDSCTCYPLATATIWLGFGSKVFDRNLISFLIHSNLCRTPKEPQYGLFALDLAI